VMYRKSKSFQRKFGMVTASQRINEASVR
jgi:hypothetical protein